MNKPRILYIAVLLNLLIGAAFYGVTLAFLISSYRAAGYAVPWWPPFLSSGLIIVPTCALIAEGDTARFRLISFSLATYLLVVFIILFRFL